MSVIARGNLTITSPLLLNLADMFQETRKGHQILVRETFSRQAAAECCEVSDQSERSEQADDWRIPR